MRLMLFQKIKMKSISKKSDNDDQIIEQKKIKIQLL